MNKINFLILLEKNVICNFTNGVIKNSQVFLLQKYDNIVLVGKWNLEIYMI